MKYNEVKIYTTQAGIEPLTDLLLHHGIDGVVIQDARDYDELLQKKNEYDWDYIDDQLKELADAETTVLFYLEQTEEEDRRLQAIKESVMKLKSMELTGLFGDLHVVGRNGYGGGPSPLGRLYLESNPVDDGDWKDTWKQYFKPTKITESLVVKPTWQAYEIQKGETVISIDPGMAFGTGTHETTSMCVHLLQKYLTKGDRILDVGCGSGILSIAAALLGADRVLGVEIDPTAVEVALENVKLNRVEGSVSIMQGNLVQDIHESVNLIIANLMADLVISLSREIEGCLKNKGIFISSGILIEKQSEVVTEVKNRGFDILEILEEGEWCAIAARLK